MTVAPADHARMACKKSLARPRAQGVREPGDYPNAQAEIALTMNPSTTTTK